MTALRLFEAGSFAFGPLAWTRTGGGTWQPFALGVIGHRTDASLIVTPEQEDELRAFCNLIGRRTPRSRRDRVGAAALRDGLRAARPVRGAERLAARAPRAARARGPGVRPPRRPVAALCATEEERPALTQRVAHIAALERPLIGGLAVDPAIDLLVGELAGHLRALLRDVLCGHLDADLRGIADAILAEAVRDAVRQADAEREAELEARAQLRARADALASAEAGDDATEGYDPGFVRFAEP